MSKEKFLALSKALRPRILRWDVDMDMSWIMAAEIAKVDEGGIIKAQLSSKRSSTPTPRVEMIGRERAIASKTALGKLSASVGKQQNSAEATYW